MADNKPYSHLDIKRYLQQQMSPGEMHAFEKAMMDDPFLSDAFDGFKKGDWRQTEQHLSDIESEIKQGKTNTKVIPISTKKTGWWRVAAIMLVIVTSGIVTYSIFKQPKINSSSTPTLAVNKPSVPAVINDSIKADERPFAKAESVEKSKWKKDAEVTPPMLEHDKDLPLASLEVNKPTDETSNLPAPHPNMRSQMPASPAATDDVSASSIQRDMVNAPEAKEFKGKVTTAAGAPLAGASVKMAGKDIATQSDNNGNFTLKSADSVAKVDVNSVGYATANAQLRKGEPENKIMLRQSSQALNEVVVKGYKTKRKNEVSASVSSIAGNTLKAVAQPSIGMVAYMQYVSKQTDSILLADGRKAANIHVSLKFSFDKKCKPSHLEASGTQDKYYLKKAIYIIKNGPIWIKNKENKGSITIDF